MKIIIDTNPLNYDAILNEIKSGVEVGLPTLQKELETKLGEHCKKITAKEKKLADFTKELTGLGRPTDEKLVARKAELEEKIGKINIGLVGLKKAERKKERDMKKRLMWWRSVTVAVPDELLGVNLAIYLGYFCDFELGIASGVRNWAYWELGVERKMGKWERNAFAYSKGGKLSKRQCKWWFFPFAPSADVLTLLKDSWDDESTVYILSDNLDVDRLSLGETDEVEIRPLMGTKKERQDELDEQMKNVADSPLADFKLDKDMVVVFPTGKEADKWARKILKRNMQDEFQPGDTVRIYSKTVSNTNVGMAVGTCVGYDGIDKDGFIQVRGPNKRIYSLGRGGAVQHDFVRSIGQCEGLRPDTYQFHLVCDKKTNDEMARTLIEWGQSNIVSYL